MSKTEAQYFLGLINYYKRFIKDCYMISKPLSELTKTIMLICADEEEKAFQSLTKAVVIAPVLRQFEPQRKIYVTGDVSRIGIAAVTEKEFETGRHPVCFASKLLNSEHQNHAAHYLELLGII